VGDRSERLILIVEDEPLVRWSLVTRLRNDGYSAEAVETGEEALAFFGQRRADLVVLDVNLTSMTGLDVLESLRARGHDGLPAIIITAYEDEALAEACRRLGVFATMGKPFTLEEFAATVARALDAAAPEQG